MGKQTPKPIKVYGPPKKPSPWRNPLVWIVAVIIGFITSFLLFGGRDLPLNDDVLTAGEESQESAPLLQDGRSEANALEATEPESEGGENQETLAALEPTAKLPESKRNEGTEARDFIQNIRSHGDVQDLGAVFSRAGQFAAAGKQTDAYLLYFFAAREGHAPSAFVLGGLSDPNHYRQGANLASEPDPLQSLKWYRVAANDGYKEARGRLEELQKWVEKRARSGDLRAQQLLLSFR